MTSDVADRLHIFGIRHHGPSSARSLAAALDVLDPACVLIEGPPEADPLIRFAASSAMIPPVAILVHGQDDPQNAAFYPFAVFSPEWQAMRWACARGRPAHFIDLPSAIRLALRAEAGSATPDPEAGATAAKTVRRDPLAYLAEIAGYHDGEAWWNALIEQRFNAPTVFAAIETAVAELRRRVDPLEAWREAEQRFEEQREAHMRLAIGAALAETDGAVAVVCGAWHVPSLRRRSGKEDRSALRGLPKIKVTATWVPWTDTRLATGGGYAAGVASPGWYRHLWDELARSDGELEPRRLTARWQARVAGLLRENGHVASPASVIEAARLAEALAALRDLALPGLDEMREAGLATLCHGETVAWRLIEQRLIIGNAVGAIDEDVPQMPLQADLARQQRQLKLKPEALEREISLDLRSDSGLAKSLLLHRLRLINVPWGQPDGSGGSRGTFRENWKLRWDPEFSVRLAEALVHGTTVEQASGNAAIASARRSPALGPIAEAVKGCLLAGLGDAAQQTIAMLQGAAAATSDIAALAEAITPLAAILRYGTARDMPGEALRLLVTSLAETVCAGLTHACRSLQTEEAGALHRKLVELDQAVGLIDSELVARDWRGALRKVADDAASHALLRGFAVRALYDRRTFAAAEAGDYLSRALSRAAPPIEAGDWLDGFLGRSGQVLLHDAQLFGIIDRWMAGLAEDSFVELLPMLRRAFSSFDSGERRRLLDALKRPARPGGGGAEAAPKQADPFAPGFAAALPLLLTILGLDRRPDKTGAPDVP
ncbi:MAG: DUF5682 family protein [Xanthobacteraceae bacterium]